MRASDGELYEEKEYLKLLEEASKDEKAKELIKKSILKLPEGILDDSIRKLQKPISENDRRSAIKKLNKRRAKKKIASMSRKKNRGNKCK